ncbi:MAG: ATP-binding protein [bacterium]
MKLSIRWKWMAGHLLVGGAVILFMVLYLSSRLEAYFETRFENRWKRELNLARKMVEASDFATLTREDADRLADDMGRTLGMRLTLIDRAGTVLGDSDVDLGDLPQVEDHSTRPEVLDALALGFGKSRRHSTTVDLDLVYLAVPIGTLQNPVRVVRVAVPVSEIEDSIAQIHRLIWLASALGFILIIVTGIIVSKSMTRRLSAMSDVAKRIATGDFSTRMSSQSNDELADLGTALDLMAENLQKYVNQITHERDQLQAILNSMVEGVTVTDRNGRILLINQSFQDIFGVSETIVDKPIKEALPNAPLLQAIELAILEKRDVVESIELAEPVPKNLEAHISILSTGDKSSGAVVVFHDITRLKQLEKIRRDFVANVSHEIRTPLTAIKGYTETLLENRGLENGTSGDFLEIILRHTDRMSKLVQDLLRLARLETVEDDAPTEEIDLAAAITKVADSFKNLDSQNQFILQINLPGTLPRVLGIATEVETVLENLIDNAIKYGGKGNVISISASVRTAEVKVEVADRGIGIPGDDQPRVFERFYRVAKGRSRVMGGTGLGLAIVKHIIQRHGGKISLESEVGKGTKISFTLPRAGTAVPQ